MTDSEEYYDAIEETVQKILCKDCLICEFEDNCSDCKAYKSMFGLLFDKGIYDQYKKMEKEDE